MMIEMGFRALSGALIVLFLVAPLSMALCGNCAPDHCPLKMMADSPNPAEQAAHSPMSDHPVADTHCQKTAEATEDPATCRDASLAAIECCDLTTAPEPGPDAAPAITVSHDFALEHNGSTDASAAFPHRGEEQRRKPPQIAPQPLYTLHSAFLI